MFSTSTERPPVASDVVKPEDESQIDLPKEQEDLDVSLDEYFHFSNFKMILESHGVPYSPQ